MFPHVRAVFYAGPMKDGQYIQRESFSAIQSQWKFIRTRQLMACKPRLSILPSQAYRGFSDFWLSKNDAVQ